MNNDLMFSSNTPEWATPQEFFDRLNDLYHFNLDVCATAENAKCEKYFTKEQDGLSQSWGGYCVWCNPPYGRGISKWVQKGYEEAKIPGTTVVMLLPARTDTAWFHQYCRFGEVVFLKGRLKFGGCKNSAPFPSMLVKFEQKVKVMT